MPLSMLTPGVIATIEYCRSKEETRKFLEGLGLIPGATVSVLSEMAGNLIIHIKGSRVAINKGIAQQLMVSPQTSTCRTERVNQIAQAGAH